LNILKPNLKHFFAVLLALTSCVQIACTPSNEVSATASTTPIRFALAQAPLNLDPRYATDAASERVNRLLYRSLVDFDAQSKPIPQLASWQRISSTQYRFTLTEKNVQKFHHGKPLTAHDVAATYASFAQLKNSPHSAEFANIVRIEVIDNSSLNFHLKTPDPQFAAKLIIGILPADLIAKGHDFSHQPVGSGPLKLFAWDNKLTLQRIADGQLITLSEVRDPTVRVLKLIRGEADILQGDLPPELVKYLQTQNHIKVATSPGSNFSYLGLNLQDPVLKNRLVRQAIAHSIDRQAIIKQVLVPGSREAAAILPPEHYTNQASYEANNYDPALAKALLQKAGIHLPLKLVYKTSTDAQRVRLATIMQAQMREAGIELEIRSLDWGTFFEEVKQGNFQLFGLTWVGIKTPEIYAKAFGSDQLPPKGFNRGKFNDPELDALIQTAMLEPGDKYGDESKAWQAVTQRIHAQLPYIPLWYEGQFVATRNDIQAYAPQADGNWDDLMRIKRADIQDLHIKAQLQ
jgi:peptide/nickel transport system substrate-binding protein